MVELITDRLIIIPCSLNMAKSLVFHRKELGIRSPIHIPDEWPDHQIQGYLPFYIERLEKDKSAYGWGIWIIIEHSTKEIIGNVSFKGQPLENGEVEIDFSVIEAYQGQGYGFEAVETMVDWALSKDDVKRIKAECEESNIPSIRILEKLGMCCYEREGKFLKWGLSME